MTGHRTLGEELGARLARARENCHLKQDAVASIIGIHRTMLSKIENGKGVAVNLGTVNKLINHYGLTMGELFKDDTSESDIEARCQLICRAAISTGLEDSLSNLLDLLALQIADEHRKQSAPSPPAVFTKGGREG